MSKTPKKRRNMGSATTSTQERRSQSPTQKRVRQKARDLDLQNPISVDTTNIFGSNWLRDLNYVRSSITSLGEDEGSSRLSNWTSFHSESPVLSSTSDVNEQSDRASPFKGAREPSVLEDLQPSSRATHSHNEDRRAWLQ